MGTRTRERSTQAGPGRAQWATEGPWDRARPRPGAPGLPYCGDCYFCKFGKSCKFSRDVNNSSSLVANAGSKSERKRLAAMVTQSIVGKLEKAAKRSKGEDGKAKSDPAEKLTV